MIAYFDTSAFVKILYEEPGSETAAEIWERAEQALVSRLVYPETRAALAAGARTGRISRTSFAAARDDLERLWRGVRVVELGDRVAGAAGKVSERLALHAADAVHLASALMVSDRGLTFVTWDRELARAALQAGLAIAPPLR